MTAVHSRSYVESAANFALGQAMYVLRGVVYKRQCLLTEAGAERFPTLHQLEVNEHGCDQRGNQGG